ARGAYVATPQEQRFIPAFEVEVVDTTAAGDTFNGALAVALAEGQDIFEAARFGNAAAALSVTRLGAQASIPRRVEIDALLLKTRSA
ncbi:MAG: PfkB family carbohydrate kinase, partial [Candidatus Aminicenantes bacterium]|nr:PfkB family carbohydrate kinase [Candidatus Aminicenantes bacterium]